MALQHLLTGLNGSLPLTYTCICTVLSIFTIAVYRLWFHPLRHVSGPFVARTTELWRTSRYFKGTRHRDILALHRQYGSVVRISNNEVSVVHPDLASSTNWYDTWKAIGGTKSTAANSFFNTTDPKEHAFLRNRVSAVYSMSYFVALDDKIQPIMDNLLDRFEDITREGAALSLSHWVSFFTYDVVGKICLGKPLGFVRDGKDVDGFIRAVHNAFYWIANMGYLPGQAFVMMHPVMVWLGQVIGLRRTDFATAFGKMSIEQVLKRKNDKPQEPTNPRRCQQSWLKSGISSLPVQTKADKTSIAIKAVLGPILQDKARYRRLQAELDEALSEDPQRKLPYSTIKDLPFLAACIKEGFRMHPSIVYQLPRKAPAGGITFDGHFIPPSATISMSALAQNWCQEIFANDADRRRPERWIVGEGSSEEEIKLMERNLASFGYGSRTCIGRNLATFEVCKFVSQLLTRFDVDLVDRDQPWSIRSLWFAEVDNMSVKLRKRDVA
ncbi:cytochrome P450 [Aspergillus aurantiobrunneus]